MSRTSEAYRTGDVFWAPDPFRSGGGPRPWLVLAAETLPFPGEEYVCAALTTSGLPANHEVADAWVAGGHPNRTSFRSPWVVATIKHRDVTGPQGRITLDFTERMIGHCTTFLGR